MCSSVRIRRRAKVAIVCDYLAIGGQERALVNLVKGFNRERVDPFVYAFRGGALADELRSLGIPLLLGSAKLPWPCSHNWTDEDEKEKLRYRYTLEVALRNDVIDAVIIFAWADGVVAAKNARVPVVIERLDGPGLIDKIKDKSSFNKVVCQSQSIYDDVISRASEFHLSPDRVSLIYSGVDLSTFNPTLYDKAKERHKLNIRQSDVVIGYIGRLQAEKNVDLLIKAFANLEREDSKRGIYLLILGPDQGELNSLKNIRDSDPRLHDRIQFFNGRNHTAPVFAALDIFAICSTNEGVPNVVLEAIAMGLPLIASDVGSIHEVVEDNAKLLPVVDVPSLTLCLSELVSSAERLESMALSSLRLRDRYDLSKVVAQYEQLIFELLADSEYRQS